MSGLTQENPTHSEREIALPAEEPGSGYASGEDPVTFSDAEAALLKFQDQPGAASKEQVQSWRAKFRSQLPRLARMEQVWK